MKSTNKRARAKSGQTSYYHRKKMISHYTEITRIRFGKKLNYYYMGIYNTHSPAHPDQCLYYAESRMMRDKEDNLVKTNLETSYFFGKLTACKVNKTDIKDKLVLDLSRRRNISYKPFLFGLISGLNPQIKIRLKHGFSEEQCTQFIKIMEEKDIGYKFR